MKTTCILLSTLFNLLAMTNLYAQVAAGNLLVDSQNRGNDTYGDWSGTNFVWGVGYPLVDVSADADERLTFPNGLERQGLEDITIASGSNLDNPTFAETYPGDLSLSHLILDAGTMRITYSFEFPTRLVDIIVVDVDESDIVQIEIFDAAGQPLNPDCLDLVSEGDLSRYVNTPDRPGAETASPPRWNPTNGTLTAVVNWNEGRSFTVFRPRIAITQVRITASGIHPLPDPYSHGSNIYTALWATPRVFEITEIKSLASSEIEITWPSLPGLRYHVMGSSDLFSWNEDRFVEGFPSPATHSTVTMPFSTGGRFFHIGVQPDLRIYQSPQSQSVAEGNAVTFSVAATGAGSLTYQWNVDGSEIVGETNVSLTITNVHPAQAGDYSVVVQDSYGSLSSDPATLTVLVAPTIVAQPKSQTVTVDDTVNFSVMVTNTATLPITYVWRKGFTPIDTQELYQRSSTFSITNVQPADAGDYRVSVSNPASSPPGYLSAPATLTVE